MLPGGVRENPQKRAKTLDFSRVFVALHASFGYTEWTAYRRFFLTDITSNVGDV
jgi:hypothetical protein